MTDNAKHLLLVEDETALRQVVAEQLADLGYTVTEADSGVAAVERLAAFAYDIVLTDLRLPDTGGIRVMEHALERYPDIPVVIMTGYGTVRDAVAAIRQGAADFIAKPFQFDELAHVLATALEQRRLRSENAYLRSQLERRDSLDGLVGQSSPMRELFALLETVARSSSTILVTGETGTGKEVVARAIHQHSPRRRERFVPINCGAIPETLLEAELFGHVRGAFTGATGNRQGRLEHANRGTLFLDEIGSMSTALQAKFLRVLQEREFDRLGDSAPIRLDVRVIAATNCDLEQLVKLGTFREDLYYRLKVIPIQLPPLRERREDVPLLVNHFLQRLGRRLTPPRTDLRFSQEAMRCLMGHAWPGNVRQLENVVERAVALSGGASQIESAALPEEIGGDEGLQLPGQILLPEDGLDFEAYIRDVERRLLLQSLERTDGNKRRAAELLRLKRTTLVEKLKRLELSGLWSGGRRTQLGSRRRPGSILSRRDTLM